MFKSQLTAQLKRIFKVERVLFDVPGESQEQEAFFVAVQKAEVRIRDARQIAKVTGTIHIFANQDKMPYGFLSKCIAEADPDDTYSLFFFNFEENKGTFRNIVERSIDFLYLFDSQYDPAIGTITSVNLTLAESS